MVSFRSVVCCMLEIGVRIKEEIHKQVLKCLNAGRKQSMQNALLVKDRRQGLDCREWSM